MATDNAFANLCIFHILDGLRFGLTRFTRQSRPALIYAISPDDPLRVYDPHELLHGHELKLEEFYLGNTRWRDHVPEGHDTDFYEDVHEDLHLSGIISFGGHSRSVYYQRWFTEEHPDICCVGPIKHMLEIAIGHMSQSFAARDVLSLDTAGHALQNCALHAIRDYIVDQRTGMGAWDTQLRIYPTLHSILAVSRTLEEGAWPRGILAFVEPSLAEKLDFLALFPKEERPSLENPKHVRKMLQAVEHTYWALISNGTSLVGICKGEIPHSAVIADYQGNYGFLRLGGELISSFTDGEFHNTTRKANLVQLEEALLEEGIDPISGHALHRIITTLVHAAMDRRHGCTLVVDLREGTPSLPGQDLAEPLDLLDPQCLDLACSLSKVDGALHISTNLKLHGFGCLLDGLSVPGENRARGARFNSAVRFTARHEKLLVVVVSSDRPVSIIQRGMELTAACCLKKHFACVSTPPTMEEFVKK